MRYTCHTDKAWAEALKGARPLPRAEAQLVPETVAATLVRQPNAATMPKPVRALAVVPAEVGVSLKCRHGLKSKQCAVCLNTARREAPKWVKASHVEGYADPQHKQLQASGNVAKCPECGYIWPDSARGNVTCPECHTKAVITTPKRGEKLVKTKATLHDSNIGARSTGIGDYIAQWTLTTKIGVLTICGVCHGLASDHNERHKIGHKYLAAFQKTKQCKYCGGELESDYEQSYTAYECPGSSPDGLCKRRWLLKKVKVPTCRLCTAELQGEYTVENASDLDRADDSGRVAICVEVLKLWRLATEEG